MRRTLTFAAGLLAAALLLTAGLQAETFVSLNGKFYIDYPDDWTQVDYNMVDLFLARSQAGQGLYDYEAVFAPESSAPFFATDYLILTVEPHDSLSTRQIDSVLADLSRTFGKGIQNAPVGNALADLKSGTPTYDKSSGVATILSDVNLADGTTNKNLLMMKFYDRGIVSFYFYSPDSLFERSKQTFYDIVASFGTENYADKLPKEQLKVSDMKTNPQDETSDSSPNKTMLYLSLAVLAVVVVFVVMRLRKKK